VLTMWSLIPRTSAQVRLLNKELYPNWEETEWKGEMMEYEVIGYCDSL
jgi:hypothetical protein